MAMAKREKILASMSENTHCSSFLQLRILGFCTQHVVQLYLHFKHEIQHRVSQKPFHNE